MSWHSMTAWADFCIWCLLSCTSSIQTGLQHDSCAFDSTTAWQLFAFLLLGNIYSWTSQLSLCSTRCSLIWSRIPHSQDNGWLDSSGSGRVLSRFSATTCTSLTSCFAVTKVIVLPCLLKNGCGHNSSLWFTISASALTGCLRVTASEGWFLSWYWVGNLHEKCMSCRDHSEQHHIVSPMCQACLQH